MTKAIKTLLKIKWIFTASTFIARISSCLIGHMLANFFGTEF